MGKPKYSYCTLDQLGSVSRGKSKHRPRNDPALYGGRYPFIQTGDVKHSQFYITGYTQTYNELGLSQSKLWPANTLCITIAANIADSAILTFPACFPDSIIGFIPDQDKSDLRFVKYCLDTYKKQMQAISKGTTQDNLSQDKLLTIKLLVPPLSTQTKIASILSAYDDLIENNKRRIAILEKMAEEIYREWFVRMRFSSYASDFAKAASDKKASEDKPAIKVKGLPVGWRIGMVKDLGKVVTGKTPPTSEARYYGDRHPFIKTPDMHSSVFLTETGEQLSEEGFAFQRSQQIPSRSICASCIGTAGVVGITTEPSQTNQQINSIVLKDDTHLEWAYFTILGLRELMNLFGATGATMTNISKGKFERLPIILPPQRVIEDFHSLAAPLFDSILNLTRQVRALMTTRDLLLPRLISGKLSVEDLELPSNEKLTAASSALPQQEFAHA